MASIDEKMTSETLEMLAEVSIKNTHEVLDQGKLLYEAAQSNIAEDFMANDIAEATATAARTQQIFRDVFAKLENIDRIYNHKFAPDWDELRKEYNNTLSLSRDLASSITAWCERLYGPMMVILKNQDIKLEAKKKTVERAMKATKDFENSSSEIANRSLKLSANLFSFKDATTQAIRGLDWNMIQDATAPESFSFITRRVFETLAYGSVAKILAEVGTTLSFNLKPEMHREELTTWIESCKYSCLLLETIWNGSVGHCKEIMSSLEDCKEEDDDSFFEILIPSSHYLALACGLRKYTQGMVV